MALQTTALAGALFGLLGVIAISLWQYKERSKIIMTPESNGWVKLAGVHPDAIRRLEDQRASLPQDP